MTRYGILLFWYDFATFVGPRSFVFNGYRDYFLAVKRPGRDVDHSPAYGSEVKNEWSYYVNVACTGISVHLSYVCVCVCMYIYMYNAFCHHVTWLNRKVSRTLTSLSQRATAIDGSVHAFDFHNRFPRMRLFRKEWKGQTRYLVITSTRHIFSVVAQGFSN